MIQCSRGGLLGLHAEFLVQAYRLCAEPLERRMVQVQTRVHASKVHEQRVHWLGILQHLHKQVWSMSDKNINKRGLVRGSTTYSLVTQHLDLGLSPQLHHCKRVSKPSPLAYL